MKDELRSYQVTSASAQGYSESVRPSLATASRLWVNYSRIFATAQNARYAGRLMDALPK